VNLKKRGKKDISITFLTKVKKNSIKADNRAMTFFIYPEYQSPEFSSDL